MPAPNDDSIGCREPSTARFTMLYDDLCEVRGLSLIEKVVLSYSVRSTSAKLKRPLPVGSDAIAKRFGLSKRAVVNAIHRLCDLELIEKNASSGGRHQTSQYVVNYPPRAK